MTKIEALRDGHGRYIRDVRVSVTDRCNFRCQYCMPAEGLPWLERDQVLGFEEIQRLVTVLASMGVCDVRLTGGEPLVRRDFPRLAKMLSAIEGVEDLSVTTNGFLLERDAEALVAAGINRFNVSVDSLQRDRFFEMTRRDALPRVLRGLEALAQFPEAHPIKINAVGMRNFTETEILPFAEFAREHPYEVRFIEFMPLDADHSWDPSLVLTGDEIRAAIDAVYPLEALPRDPSATARDVRLQGRQGQDRLHQPAVRALLRRLRPHPRDGGGQAADVPVQPARDRPAHADPRRRQRRRAARDHPRRRVAQGAQARGQRARLPAARADDVADRRLAQPRSPRRDGQPCPWPPSIPANTLAEHIIIPMWTRNGPCSTRRPRTARSRGSRITAT